MKYEVQIENKMINIFTVDHNRSGLMAALKKIERAQRDADFVSAIIRSPRDGVIYSIPTETP